MLMLLFQSERGTAFQALTLFFELGLPVEFTLQPDSKEPCR